MKNSLKNYIKALIVFAIVFSLFLFTSFIEHRREVQSREQKLKEKLTSVETDVQSIIAYKIAAANGLKAYANMNETFSQEEYSDFASGIYEAGGDVMKNMSFITDTTLTHLYPYEEYKGGIGKDLSQVEGQRDWILYAKDTGKTIFTAPVELVEGGTGLIVRIPVDSNGEYIGQISMVFDYYKLLEESGINALSEDNYVSIISKDSLRDMDYTIWTNEENRVIAESEEAVSNEIEVYDSTLLISVIPKDGFAAKNQTFYTILIIGFFVSGVFSLISYKFLNANDKLRINQNKLIKAQEKLIATNEYLNETVNKLKESEDELKNQYIEVKKKEEHISIMAERDFLTNLFNRRKCVEDLETAIESHGFGTVALIDIDNFKNINDTLGHSYGDRVLQHVGSLLSYSFPERATPYRIGGDEFIVHIPFESDCEKIEGYLEDMFNRFKTYNSIDNVKNHITASVGIAKYPEDGITADEIIMKGDIAMYDAKKLGKNRYCHFSLDMVSRFDWKVKVENELREAVEQKKFKLLYQPVIDSKTDTVSYFEALIRIENSDLSPAVFIDVAEETGLIIKIGEWVLEEALNQLKEWKSTRDQVRPIAINVSPLQISQEDFPDVIKRSIDDSGLDPSLIEVEVTENMLMDDRDGGIKALERIRDIGVSIALDDFGTGYSSLSYLTDLPAKKVKLDKSIKDRFINFEETQVMEGIISICHGLNFEVVTEGVEDEEEYRRLLQNGSDYVQGYLFSKPLPPEEAMDFLEKFEK